MRLWIPLIIILLLSFYVVEVKEEMSIHQTQEKLSQNLNNLTPIITEQLFPYKDPYQNNFTIKDFILNTGHVLVYPIIQEFHTIIGVSVNVLWKYATKEIVWEIWQMIQMIIIIWLIIMAIKPGAIIYLMIQEWKEKRNESKRKSSR